MCGVLETFLCYITTSNYFLGKLPFFANYSYSSRSFRFEFSDNFPKINLMLRFILGCAFASISSSYNLPNHQPTIEDQFTIPAILSSNKDVQTHGSGVLQLPVKVHDVQLQTLTSGEMRKRQSIDPLANVINGYTIDSRHPLQSQVHLTATL